MKVILKGKPSCQWFLDGQMVCGGVEREITDKQLAEAKKSGLIEELVDAEEKPKVKVYTEKELYAKNKDAQLALLKKLGVEPSKKNNEFKLEKDRVDAILEAQE